MKATAHITQKIISVEVLMARMAAWRVTGKKVAFTNGCFDLLHQGHIYSLSEAAHQADYLVVGLNADGSVHRLKGEGRPVNDQYSRALVLASLVMVDAVVIFEEDTPLELIRQLKPDVLVKGGDYTIDQVAGAKEVIAAGGKVVINPILEGFSTTSIIAKLAR
ncbi:MAG: D-glycero-beta-D-manno-heptose 1-phosphate adenylyltransferase [Chitinophagaceae bacterium]|nr:D-glycero-beta-D-manno-heptose 1-phosphate adenylyltransferase [Chitinophagaceae bacterium]